MFTENTGISKIAEEIKDTKRARICEETKKIGSNTTPPLEIYAIAAVVNELRRIADAVEKILDNNK